MLAFRCDLRGVHGVENAILRTRPEHSPDSRHFDDHAKRPVHGDRTIEHGEWFSPSCGSPNTK